MKIELYKSALCPRCAHALRVLKKISDENQFKKIEIITYDIATDFKIFKENSIKMIPTISCNGKNESWIIPKESQIREFLSKEINR